jgi:hypothetical protein
LNPSNALLSLSTLALAENGAQQAINANDIKIPFLIFIIFPPWLNCSELYIKAFIITKVIHLIF